jgi:hypothetical protein
VSDCCATSRIALELVVVASGDSGYAQSPGNSVLLPTAYVPPPASPVLVLLGTGLGTPDAQRHTLAMVGSHRHPAGFLCTWRITAHVAAHAAALALLSPIQVVLLGHRIEMWPFVEKCCLPCTRRWNTPLLFSAATRVPFRLLPPVSCRVQTALSATFVYVAAMLLAVYALDALATGCLRAPPALVLPLPNVARSDSPRLTVVRHCERNTCGPRICLSLPAASVPPWAA